ALGVFTALYLVRDALPYARVLDWLAGVSYPLYLVHTVIGWVVMHFLYRLIPSWYVVVPVTAAIVIAMAAAIHRYVEVPTTRLGRRLSPGTPARDEAPAQELSFTMVVGAADRRGGTPAADRPVSPGLPPRGPTVPI